MMEERQANCLQKEPNVASFEGRFNKINLDLIEHSLQSNETPSNQDDNPFNIDNMHEQDDDDDNDEDDYKKCINLGQINETLAKNVVSLANSKFGFHQKEKKSDTLNNINSNQNFSIASVDFIQSNQECQKSLISSSILSSEVSSNFDSKNANPKATSATENEISNINFEDNYQESMDVNLTRQYTINETLPVYNNQNISSYCDDDLVTKTEALPKMYLSKAPGYPQRISDSGPDNSLSHQKMPYKELVCLNSLPLIDNQSNNYDKVDENSLSSDLESKMYLNNKIDTTCDNFFQQISQSNSPEAHFLPAFEIKDGKLQTTFENHFDNFKSVSCNLINQLTPNHMGINLDLNTIAKEDEETKKAQEITCSASNQIKSSRLEYDDVINDISYCKQQRDDNAISTSVIWNPSPAPNQFMSETRINTNKKSQRMNYQSAPQEDCDSDEETDKLLEESCENEGEYDDVKKGKCKLRNGSTSCRFVLSSNDITNFGQKNKDNQPKVNSKEAILQDVSILFEGVVFRALYLGSTQLVCESQATKVTRMMQAEEAVSRIKAPEGESQPSTAVDFFISTEKIMLLDTIMQKVIIDHSLRTVSYIADIGKLLVLICKRKKANNNEDGTESKIKSIPKMICHVFESDEAKLIAQTVSQAFQISYRKFLKTSGAEDKVMKGVEYQQVLNAPQMRNELERLVKIDCPKEVLVSKEKGEILGLVVVESGWGSLLPTAVIANIAYQSPAAKCGQLNIGDQIIAINGTSLVGLPLCTCQHHIKNTKSQIAVKLTIVPCNPVAEVKIKRPDTRYQLGFSVQNGVICSLMRGGIAERGGVRVGHRIIEINETSVVAVSHERIVKILATSVGEISMKTMPIPMFRLLTGEESPVFI